MEENKNTEATVDEEKVDVEKDDSCQKESKSDKKKNKKLEGEINGSFEKQKVAELFLKVKKAALQISFD